MKVLIVSFLILMSGSAFADQCSYVSLNQALGAVELINEGERVMLNCEPCAGDFKEIFQVQSISMEPVESDLVEPGQYYQVMINGVARDLAYLFLETKGQYAGDDYSVFTNVSKMVGCSSEGVSSFLNDFVPEQEL